MRAGEAKKKRAPKTTSSFGDMNHKGEVPLNLLSGPTRSRSPGPLPWVTPTTVILTCVALSALSLAAGCAVRRTLPPSLDTRVSGAPKVPRAVSVFLKQHGLERAQACLSPWNQLETLVVNVYRTARLYNAGYGPDNSLVESIRRVHLSSYKFITFGRPCLPAQEPDPDPDSRQTVEVAAQLIIKWKDEGFNTTSGQQTRFITLNRFKGGWKIEGMGTGP